MMIAGNLMKALTAIFAAVESSRNPLWAKGEDILLWADGICINQDDLEEKNAQVSLMAKIYQRAKGTIGYIGTRPLGQDPHLPFLALARFSGANLEDDSIPTDKLNDGNSNGLGDFWANKWFMRSWVTQEAALSREIICFYGNDVDHITFSLDLLGSLIQSAQTPGRVRLEVRHFNENPTGGHHPGVQVYSWCQLRSSLRREPEGINMVKVLNLVHPADATDKRDKVYSILGLLRREDRKAIRVDYSSHNTVEQVYTDLAKYCIGTSDCMRMLEHAGTTRQIPNMPSWVPDCSYQPRYPLDSRLYRCAGNTTINVRISPDGRKLHLNALTFDKIIVLGPRVTYPDAVLTDSTAGDISDPGLILVGLGEIVYQMCNHIHRRFGRYPGQGNLSDIISRTLTADRGLGDRRATPEDVQFYEAFTSQYPRGQPTAPNQDLQRCYPFRVVALHCQRGRRICSTRAGLVGIVPDDARVGIGSPYSQAATCHL
ncbi:MAG: hypothetical protein M1839_001339 [Geoglossum umbratile]|nr:MAG: hypothetical protein M1839_001339 [Geoglossum umbratile]